MAVEERVNEAREIGAISYDEDASKFRALDSVFDDENDSAPGDVASLMRKYLNECVDKLWNSIPRCDYRLRGANDVYATVIGADDKPTIAQIILRQFLALELVDFSFEA